MKCNVLFGLFSLSFCYVICHIKVEKNIIIPWLRKQKRRTQTAKGNQQIRTDNVDRDRLSDTEEHEPYLVGKIQVVAIRRHKRVICGEQKRKGEFSRKTLDPTD